MIPYSGTCEHTRKINRVTAVQSTFWSNGTCKSERKKERTVRQRPRTSERDGRVLAGTSSFRSSSSEHSHETHLALWSRHFRLREERKARSARSERDKSRTWIEGLTRKAWNGRTRLRKRTATRQPPTDRSARHHTHQQPQTDNLNHRTRTHIP